MMDLSLIDKQKNLKRPYFHVADLNLSSSAGTDRAEIRIGIQDLWVWGIIVIAYDSYGYRLDIVTESSELFKMSIYDDNGMQLQADPINIFSFNELNRIPSFRGFYLKAQSKVTIDMEALAFPPVGYVGYPVKAKVHLCGYRLDNHEQKNQAAESFKRIKQPYTYTREFELESNDSTDSDTIDTGSEDMFIHYLKTFGLDSSGVVLESASESLDIISLKLAHGEEQFQDNWIDIVALNEAMKSIHWKGWILEKKRTLDIQTKAETFPATAAGLFPKKFQLNLTGYKLL